MKLGVTRLESLCLICSRYNGSRCLVLGIKSCIYSHWALVKDSTSFRPGRATHLEIAPKLRCWLPNELECMSALSSALNHPSPISAQGSHQDQSPQPRARRQAFTFVSSVWLVVIGLFELALTRGLINSNWVATGFTIQDGLSAVKRKDK